MKTVEDVPLPLEVHLEDLRWHLLRGLIYVMLSTGIAFSFHKELFKVVLTPALDLLASADGHIITTRPSEAFFAHFNLALMLGIIFASPALAAELLAFLWRALPVWLRKGVWLIVPIIVVLFCAGVAFSYFIVVPIILKFFIGFAAASEMQSLYTIGEYISFLTRMSLITGLSFEVPVLVVLLIAAGIVSTRDLGRQRPYLVVGIFIAAAVVTPTGDPITMSLVGVPVYILFELSLIFGRLIEHRRKAPSDEEN